MAQALCNSEIQMKMPSLKECYYDKGENGHNVFLVQEAKVPYKGAVIIYYYYPDAGTIYFPRTK